MRTMLPFSDEDPEQAAAAAVVGGAARADDFDGAVLGRPAAGGISPPGQAGSISSPKAGMVKADVPSRALHFRKQRRVRAVLSMGVF